MLRGFADVHVVHAIVQAHVDGEWMLPQSGSAGFMKLTMATCWLLRSPRSGSC